MINKIIDFSINNKFIIGLFTLALIGVGLWSVSQVPIDAVPDITNNQVQIITQSPNLGTEDIEQFVTYPIEVAMSNLPNVSEIRSVSRFGLSVVTIVFDDEVGTYLPRQLVAEKLPEIQKQIPDGFGEPSMGPISTGLGEVYQYTLEVDEAFKGEYSLTELRTMQDWIVRRQMAMVSGVVEVNAFGGNKKQYEVTVDPNELRAIGISISEVFTALSNNNENVGGAYIERNHKANFIRGEGLARTVSDIENIVIKNAGGVPIKIKDVGEVKIGSSVRYGALTKDGKGEAVGGMILMLKGANSNKVIEAVKERIAEIQKSLPEGVQIKPFLDRSELIEKTTGTITLNLLEGGLIVVFVLMLLLGNWRGGLIVASTIPLSLLFAFILMNIFGVWANLMSLGAIDFGIIVDGAVIIVESTVFLMYSYAKKNEGQNTSMDAISGLASKKMMNAAFFGQLIILIVFLPILALEGVEGKMFQPMALTFIFAMIGAMILCLTYVPMISALFLKAPKPNEVHKHSYGDKFVFWVEEKYKPLLIKSLTKGKTIIVSAVVLFLIALFAFTKMGGEFIPQLDEGTIAFHDILKPGSSLTESINITTKIERIVKSKFPEVESIISRIGVADVPTDPMPMDIADVFVILKPEKEWVSASSKSELVEKIKEAISVVPGVGFEFTQPIEMRFNELLTGVREDVAIKLFGEDLDVLARKSEEMGQIIATVPGVADIKVEATAGLPQITIHYNRNKLAQYGLHINTLNNTVQAAFAGGHSGVIFEGEKRFDLVVRLKEENRKSISDIQNLFINLPSGFQIPLREVADISYEPGPMQISRDNTNRRSYVGINIRDRDVKSVVEEIKQKLDAQFELPSGYFIRYGGAFENLERATNRLKMVVPIALLLIFTLIYFALKSFKQTIMIYLAIPMATIGGVFALWLRDMPFSISAGIGFIVLFGVAVLNGLVMISGLNELKEEGVINLRDRIVEGTKRRIRPILLTAFTDVLGFLPMAISSSAGAEVQRPLATVVIGGLITSTLLTLFILPIFYQWIENKSITTNFAGNKSKVVFLLIALLVIIPFANAQEIPKDSILPISLVDAIKISKENYPILKSQKLEVEKQNALKGSAYDFGKTQIFTGGEEINESQGVYTTIGFGQQSINIFGVSAKNKLQKQRVKLAETAYLLSELEVEQEVKKAWSDVFKAKQKLLLFEEMDSIYGKFSRAIALNLEVESISKLEYASAKNQALQILNKKQQAQSDYDITLQRFNLWLVSDAFYTVASNLDESIFFINMTDVELEKHPSFILTNSQLNEAQANYKMAKSDMLPKLNLQGGLQRLNGQNGFYSYQAGLSIPLFSGLERSKVKALKIEKQIIETDVLFKQDQIKAAYKQIFMEYKKWQTSWVFYTNNVLPLAKEQRKGALFAYTEGALDYTAFSQIMRDAIQIEIDALTALDNYLQALFELQYFKNEKNEK
ncbi:CusA/CzcA family heavy metal efflux RND transporter [Cellulophaga sp. HaHaR_3_176]|uniref:CusA/CzcA family heavy metal efflux RND transporter n=1 Tax=Cellulophaga sp. HaHaR_3_176 TaxID=1942464 RepID=UPI001C1F90EB|nr:CusA/CzcA family heavy metal efflux RND transporter [Cellulophaga sp. HaHaR_3_176]QWX84760.1 CusA/CzcA family heavy metal efflux RND transporter [Cellulophaga sp. HaHaR_3_176]